MRHALLQRFGHGLLVLWAAFTLSFVLLQVLPGDAVLIKFQNPDLGLSPAQIEEMRVAYGADSPLWQQYGHTLLAIPYCFITIGAVLKSYDWRLNQAA